MYKNNVGYYIKDTEFSLFELLDRYQAKRLVFPDLPIQSSKKHVLTRKSIDALLYGIPYPKVYFSELQNGQCLVLETNNSLRSLIEYLSGKFEIEMVGLSLGSGIENDSYYDGQQLAFYDLLGKDQQDILRSKIQVSILEYGMPQYEHLKIGSYIERWNVEEEEAVRRILYADKGIYGIQNALCINPKTQRGLKIEAEYVSYLTYLYNFFLKGQPDSKIDWYILQDIMFSNMYRYESYLFDGGYTFSNAREGLGSSSFFSRYGRGKTTLIRIFEDRFPQFRPARGHLLGLAACICHDVHNADKLIDVTYKILEIVCDSGFDKSIADQFRNSDLSSISIERILYALRLRIND